MNSPALSPDAALLPALAHSNPRAITWRSILLGLCGTCLICGVTPYNDYALNNTFLVGNNLPLGAVMLLFVFAVFVNGPLSKWAPRRAFSSGEIAIAFSMMLVGCALPSSGLMRYLPATLVTPFDLAGENGEYRAMLNKLHLPRWIFPSFAGKGADEWVTDPIVKGFTGRWTANGPYPYAAWIRPALTWGVFLFALYGALLCLVSIVRRQWFENERLPFPLAQIEVALIEQPEPGRLLNGLLGARSFWLAFGAIFALHIWRGLVQYQPNYFADIPVHYDFYTLLSEPPWVYLDTKIKECAVFFAVVGVTYFLPSSVAFSLWMFYVLQNVWRVWVGTHGGDYNIPGQGEQVFGGSVAYAIVLLWIGRHHWALVMRQAFRGERPGEPLGRYLSYPHAFWGLVGCACIMLGWLVIAGCTVAGSIVIILLLLLAFMVITRMVAEAGLLHGAGKISVVRPFQMLVEQGFSKPVPLETFFFGSLIQSVHYDYREVVPVYATHGLKCLDQTAFGNHTMTSDTAQERSQGRRVIGLLMLALLVGYVTSFGSTLWTEYKYVSTKDVAAKTPINEWGARQNVQYQVMDATVQYDRGQYFPAYNAPANWTFGFLVTGVLSFLRLRFAWWPLHPVGYLMLASYPIAHLWFSTFLGWLAKTLVVRFGGSRGYLGARPFFLGLIVGESAAAGFWLVTGIVMSALNVPYRPINIMPG